MGGLVICLWNKMSLKLKLNNQEKSEWRDILQIQIEEKGKNIINLRQINAILEFIFNFCYRKSKERIKTKGRRG